MSSPFPNSVQLKDITVTLADIPAGDYIRNIDGNDHSFALSPNRPTLTPIAEDGGKMNDIRWEAHSIGYLPSSLQLTSAILEQSKVTYVRLPDRFFKQAAYETVDGDNVGYRWLSNVIDPVAAGLISTLGAVAEQADRHEWPLISESIGTALAVSVMRHLGANPVARAIPYPEGLSQHTLKLVTDYIEANLSSQIRLTELAGIAMLSPFHFARSFKKSTGMAPVAYVWHRRMVRAKEALRNQALPLVAVAYDCGYSSQSHFTTAFRKATGQTPAAWRATLS